MIKVSFSFDDGSEYDLRTADMLNAHGFSDVTFYIPVNWRRYLGLKYIEALTIDDVKNLSTKYKIGSHGVNHSLLTQVGSDTQDREIIDSYVYWNENGFNVDSFCYPRGYYNEEIKAKVKKAGYKNARTVKVGYLKPSEDPYETNTTVHVGYDRDEYETDWYTYAKEKVKDAIMMAEQGQDVVYHAWAHSEELHRYQQWDRFGLFLRYLKENIPDD